MWNVLPWGRCPQDRGGISFQILITFLFLLQSLILSSQPLLHLEIFAERGGLEKIEKHLPKEKVFSDSLSVFTALNKAIINLHGDAYLEASIDQIKIEDSLYTAYLHLGKPYEWAALKNGNVDNAFLEQVGFRERLYENKAFNYKEVQQLQNNLLNYAENNGYPFAVVWLDSIAVVDERFSAQLMMQTGPLIYFEKVNMEESVKISTRYLENYLGIDPGSPYSHEKVLKIRDRLRELPFLKERRNATVSFIGKQATVNLYLEKKRSSRFDFLIGLLPGTLQNPKTKFTGTATLDFFNQFGLGERLFIDYQRLRPATQTIDLQFNYPYVLNLPFGIDFQFQQYKLDSTNNDVTFDIGVQYLFAGGNYLKAFWNNKSSNLLDVDAQRLLNNKTLPESLDFSTASFGLEYYLQRLDYRFNPRKGFSMKLRGSAGFKNTRTNNSILGLADPEDPSFRFEQLYDSLQLNSFQYQFEGTIENYLPIFQRSTLKTAIQSGWVISEQAIYQNEQFRIGGNRLLRGYDEQSVFATNFAVFILEYRLLIDQNSALFVFGDYGYVEDVTREQRRFRRPLGFGVGLSFYANKVGLIGFSLAWQRELGVDIPSRFRDAKIHFGLESFF